MPTIEQLEASLMSRLTVTEHNVGIMQDVTALLRLAKYHRDMQQHDARVIRIMRGEN